MSWETQAKSDLTPDATGRASRTKYWSQALTEQHELFHVSDWSDKYHKPKIAEAETFIETQEVDVTTANLVPTNVLNTKKSDFNAKVLEKTNEAQNQYNPGKETRAYADGKAGYTALSSAITP